MVQHITFIGLGKMGSAMAEKLLKAGVPLTVYNRTPEKAEPFVALGAVHALSIKEAVENADVIFTSLIDDAALLDVTADILKFIKNGAIHVSTSTILPKTAETLDALHHQVGCVYVAAPVLGVPEAIRAKSATAYCAGNEAAAACIKPLLLAYTASVQYLGTRACDANVMKICLNYSLITTIELVSELYAFSEKSGLKTEIVQAALKQIYAHPAFQLYVDKVHDRTFDDVNFDMKGGNKDTALFQDAFAAVGVSPDIANIVRGKFTQALSNDMEHKDWSAIADIVRKRSGLS
jgi:3-hydroxyisobutyrate dehydrogenase-like beta-hydroxyacid dehydrogenase